MAMDDVNLKKKKKKKKKKREIEYLSEWASLVLPYLPPPSLASASVVCKTLHDISTSITAQRVSDAARGLEKHPIPFQNKNAFLSTSQSQSQSQPYSYFLYTPSSCILPSLHCFRQSWGGDGRLGAQSASIEIYSSGCGCTCMGGNCSSSIEGCPCNWVRTSDVMSECGPKCRCGSDCGNRPTQGGVSVELSIVMDERKGWGLHSAQTRIRKGEFVCEYAGEFLTTQEARRRQKTYDDDVKKCSAALLVVREHLPSGEACLRVNIDATRIGNVGRFINHSCDGGNLASVLVRSCGVVVPRLCFFAVRDIAEGEELTFSYGDVRRRRSRSYGESLKPCFCGTPDCLGMLPSEET